MYVFSRVNNKFLDAIIIHLILIKLPHLYYLDFPVKLTGMVK